MKTIEHTDLSELMAVDSDCCISIYLPTHHSGREIRQDSIRLRNLADEAGEKLQALGEAGRPLRKKLDALAERLASTAIGAHRGHGVAIFVSPETEQVRQLIAEPEPGAFVQQQFEILPLLRQQHLGRSWHVLTLSREVAQLYEGSFGTFSEVTTDEFPLHADEVVGVRDPEEQLKFAAHRTTAGDNTMFHGHGEGEVKIDSDRDHFLAGVGQHLNNVLKQGVSKDSPLYLVATQEVAGHFTSRCDVTIDEIIHASPDGLSLVEIHDRVQQAASKSQSTRRDALLERIGTAKAEGRGSDELNMILRSAQEGRVDTLVVFGNAPILGTYDEQLQTADIKANQADGSDKDLSRSDLINLAAMWTLANSGEVECVDPDAEPSVAAILRY